MELQKVKAITRNDTSKPAKNALRKDGFITSVLYGGAGEILHLALEEKAWQKLFDDHGSRNMILDLIVDDNEENTDLIKVAEVQRHPIKGYILHIDLIRLTRGVTANFNVNLKYTGKPVGEKAGGIGVKHEDYIEIACFPRNVPEFFEVDISHLEIGDDIRAGDIPWDFEDVELVTDKDKLLYVVEHPRIIAEPTEEDGVEGEGESEDGESEESK